jgi:Peptidase family M49
MKPSPRFSFRNLIFAFAIFFAAAALAFTQQSQSDRQQSSIPSNPTPEMAVVDQPVAPDLAQRLARYRRVDMPYHSEGLTAREKQLIEKLVDASGLVDDVYWRQSDPEGLALYKSLQSSTKPADELLRRMLKINGSRFDLIDNEKPFVGAASMPPGRGFYPPGLTRDQIEKFVAAHPDQKDAVYSHYTVISGSASDLKAIPYHEAYKEFVEPMAADLHAAAQLTDDPAFAKFLRLRADSLLTDDYFASDSAWLDMQSPKIDVVFAPYETYTDFLMGVKATYGASVMIRNEEESKRLALYQKYVPDLQEALPLSPEDLPSKRGTHAPMEVVDSPFRAGDLLHGYQAVADNLPNDPRVIEQKGSKRIFWKNFMDARVNYIILPLAKHVLKEDQAAMVSGEGYMAATVMHEISHGLGPAFARTSSGKKEIDEAIGHTASGLEEAKADVVGMYGLAWLAKKGAIDASKMNAYYASYVGGIFRTVRFGIAEAHGQAEMMEFNYLVENHALNFDSASGRYFIDFAKMPITIASLAKELLEIEATGDRARAEAWMTKYDVMPPELTAALGKTTDIPIDIDPVFSLHTEVR